VIMIDSLWSSMEAYSTLEKEFRQTVKHKRRLGSGRA